MLLVCIGKATKLAEELQASPKQYLAGVTFGATTPSYDLEKDIDREFPLDRVSEASLRSVLPDFVGEQEQVAPLFSAKSVDGVRAYEMARRAYKEAQRSGASFDHAATELLSRQRINIYSLELERFIPTSSGAGIEPENASLRSAPPIASNGPLPLMLPRVAQFSGPRPAPATDS